MAEVRPRPLGWGRDRLTSFLDACMQNTYATFENQPEWYQRLSDIDAAYHLLVDNLERAPELYGGFFAFRSHVAFLGACRLAFAGQVPETYMLLRSCLEAALYGLYVTKNTRAQQIWVNRHRNEQAREAVKSEFTISRLKKCLAATDAEVHARLSKFYEYTIDLGAHPNIMSVEASLDAASLKNVSGPLELHYLHPPSNTLLATFKTCAVVGITGLDVYRYVFQNTYEQCGLTERVVTLKQGL